MSGHENVFCSMYAVLSAFSLYTVTWPASTLAFTSTATGLNTSPPAGQSTGVNSTPVDENLDIVVSASTPPWALTCG